MSFSELNLPREEIHGVHTGKWFVSESGTHMCLINSTTSFSLAPAGGTETENAKFYFDTLLEAHACSAGYYMNFGMAYPHADQMNVELNVPTNATVSSSQVMEFV